MRDIQSKSFTFVSCRKLVMASDNVCTKQVRMEHCCHAIFSMESERAMISCYRCIELLLSDFAMNSMLDMSFPQMKRNSGIP